MSSSKSKANKGGSGKGASASASGSKPVPATPSAWYQGRPVDEGGLQPGPRVLSLPHGSPGSGALAPVTIRRSKPGNLESGKFREIESPVLKEHGIVSFAPPGRRSGMHAVASDVRLSDMTVAHVAANTLKGALWRNLVIRGEKALKQEAGKPDKDPDRIGALEAGLEKRRQRHMEHTKAARTSNAEVVMRDRQNVADLAARQSEALMEKSPVFSGMAVKKAKADFGMSLVEANARQYETVQGNNKRTKKDNEFIERMENLAPHMRASMYFNASDEKGMLDSGALFAKHTRIGLGMGNKSKTTDTDAQKLGNHDHVFFFMEHRDAPMRKTRFSAESTESGTVFGDGQESGNTPGARRISFPLASVMQKGTWAMKQDFLSLENGLEKRLGAHDNIVATPERDPDKAARHVMRQFALSALDMSKNAKAERNTLTDRDSKGNFVVGDRDFVRTVFGNYMRPQLMVPSVMPFDVRGARLDMPASDKPSAHGGGQAKSGEKK